MPLPSGAVSDASVILNFVARKSGHSVYPQNLASFDMTGYDARDSAGFIRLFGLQTRGRKRLSPMGVGKVAANG